MLQKCAVQDNTAQTHIYKQRPEPKNEHKFHWEH